MKKNIGNTDRIIRIAVVLLIAILYFTEQVSGLAALLLVGLALVFTITSCIGSCPLYIPFDISTKENK